MCACICVCACVHFNVWDWIVHACIYSRTIAVKGNVFVELDPTLNKYYLIYFILSYGCVQPGGSLLTLNSPSYKVLITWCFSSRVERDYVYGTWQYQVTWVVIAIYIYIYIYIYRYIYIYIYMKQKSTVNPVNYAKPKSEPPYIMQVVYSQYHKPTQTIRCEARTLLWPLSLTWINFNPSVCK